jgi:FKBP-type peptidyl-prolyl cis-trans isomerase (trigger factor)
VRADLGRQVEEKLLAMADFALPEEMVKSMAESAANRQRMQLAYQGVSRDQIEKAAPQIAEGAQKKTERDSRSPRRKRSR